MAVPAVCAMCGRLAAVESAGRLCLACLQRKYHAYVRAFGAQAAQTLALARTIRDFDVDS